MEMIKRITVIASMLYFLNALTDSVISYIGG